jgi:hypothetical protein
MIQKAHEISLEAGSRMATAMKDVIYAAAGIAPFAAESAKDLLNYMVRRGQMGAEEAAKIIRDIEAVTVKGGAAKPVEGAAPGRSAEARTTAPPHAAHPAAVPVRPAAAKAPTKTGAHTREVKTTAGKPAGPKKSAGKSPTKKSAPARKGAKKK